MSPLDIATFEKLKASGNLPSPKGVALAIMRLTQREDASMAEMARIIKSDPAFVGRLIKAANSVNANPGRAVVSVQEALVVLGMPAVRNLALGLSLLSQYGRGGCKGFDYAGFWSASLACGIALQALTLRTRAAPAEDAFSVGLLARIGELALATLYPEEYADVLGRAAQAPPAGLAGLETERFALNHRDLTAAMLSDWRLPKIFCQVVYEHETCDATRHAAGSREYLLVYSLALARQIAAICTAAEERRAAALPRLFALGERLSIEGDELQALCDGAVREWRDWAAILNVSARALPSFGELAAASAKSPADASAAQRLRVLVVAAGPALRQSVRPVLEQAGYAVSEAADGRAGLQAALDAQPHMLLTERALPQQDGLQLIRLLRETRLGRGMYVLMFAAADETDARLIEGFEAGVDDYLRAPPDAPLLLARLRAGQRLVRLHEALEHEREELRRFAAELSVSNRRLREAALTDVLTGLPNRRHAMERIEQEWAAGTRSGRPLACLVVDLDHLKEVNDANGHDVGDAYLQQAAAAIRSATRAQDLVCRTGGDEFLVICPDTPLPAALACAERMRRVMEQRRIEIGALSFEASLSVGVAVREEGMDDADALIKCADEGVYLAKQRGRNRIAAAQARDDTPKASR
jgi:diguanylate cyclase (GGDEF)-like protein